MTTWVTPPSKPPKSGIETSEINGRLLVDDQEIVVYNDSQVVQDIADQAAQLAQTSTDLFTQRNNLEVYTPNNNVNPKAVYNSGGDIFVVTQKPHGNGYVRIRLRDGVVTVTESVGGSAELKRITEVLNTPECLILKSQDDLNSNAADWINSTNAYVDRALETRITANNTAGKWIEYNVTIPDGVNFIQTLVYGSSGSCSSVEVSVDGAVVQTVSFQRTNAQWFRLTTPINPGTHVIRFKSLVNGYITLAGTNVYDLNKYKNGSNFDKVFTRHLTDSGQYITSSGSLDYAIWDADMGMWCGSYHGGETRIRLAYILDGVTISLNTDGDKYIGNVFELEQDTNIVNKLTSYTRQIFRLDGSREMEMVLDGQMNITTLFTNMTTTHPSFNIVLYPKRLSITTDGNYYLTDGCNYVIQKNTSNNQKVITILNNNIYPKNLIGRTPYVKGQTGNYNKVYKANIDSTEPVNFTGGSFRTVHIFE